MDWFLYDMDICHEIFNTCMVDCIQFVFQYDLIFGYNTIGNDTIFIGSIMFLYLI